VGEAVSDQVDNSPAVDTENTDTAETTSAENGDAKEVAANDKEKKETTEKPKKEVYVVRFAGLPADVPGRKLRSLFEQAGDVFTSHIVRYKTMKCRGYGFIMYKTKEAAQQTIQTLSGISLYGNTLSAKYWGKTTISSGIQQFGTSVLKAELAKDERVCSDFIPDEDMEL
jgi:RNA recognition motif-containing protein